MKKFLQIASLVAILGFGVANAEQSGGFLGAEIGYGSISVPLSYSYQVARLGQSTITRELLVNFNGGGLI